MHAFDPSGVSYKPEGSQDDPRLLLNDCADVANNPLCLVFILQCSTYGTMCSMISIISRIDAIVIR